VWVEIFRWSSSTDWVSAIHGESISIDRTTPVAETTAQSGEKTEFCARDWVAVWLPNRSDTTELTPNN
jgi:hypothetical protein